jgi:acetylornithine deacetylase/succinyl-diaminopimelate desuccinylase-like protein
VLDAGAHATVAVYFMYDVKQFVPEEWSSPPLEGRLVQKAGLGSVCMGRGAVNQKGPQNSFLSALIAFKATGKKLPVNLVLVSEGEEEIGSPHFGEITNNPEVFAQLKKCSAVLLHEANQERNGSIEVELGSQVVVEWNSSVVARNGAEARAGHPLQPRGTGGLSGLHLVRRSIP